MDKEAKVFIGFALGMVALVVAGAVLLSRSPNPAEQSSEPISDPAILIRDYSPKIGPDDAKVKIVEFGDYQCPGCAAADPVVKSVISEYEDSVQFIYRHFPLSFHQNARPAALAAEAAGKQGKFWEMHTKLYASQEDWSEKSNAPEIFITYAKELGLDEAKFKEDTANADLAKQVDDDMTDGNSAGVNSTPTFFINDVKYSEVFSPERLKSIIESELAK